MVYFLGWALTWALFVVSIATYKLKTKTEVVTVGFKGMHFLWQRDLAISTLSMSMLVTFVGGLLHVNATEGLESLYIKTGPPRAAVLKLRNALGLATALALSLSVAELVSDDKYGNKNATAGSALVVALLLATVGLFCHRGLPRMLMGGKRRLVPKTARQLLAALFGGMPAGTPFVSYSWMANKEENFELPRKVASLFPRSWLDVDNLVPGSSITQSCEDAVKAAPLRLVFANDDYLNSANCKTEWNVISGLDLDTKAEQKAEREKSLVFVHPYSAAKHSAAIFPHSFTVTSAENAITGGERSDRGFVDGGKVHQLWRKKTGKGMGTVQALDGFTGAARTTPANMSGDLDAALLIWALIETGQAKRLFKLASPAINEDWLPTVACLLRKRGGKFWMVLPFAFVLLAVPVCIWWAQHHQRVPGCHWRCDCAVAGFARQQAGAADAFLNGICTKAKTAATETTFDGVVCPKSCPACTPLPCATADEDKCTPMNSVHKDPRSAVDSLRNPCSSSLSNHLRDATTSTW